MTILDPTLDPITMEQFLQTALPEGDISVRSMPRTGGIVIDAADVDPDALLSHVQEHTGGISKDLYSIENIGSSLSESFFKEIIYAIIISFILMGIIVFIIFRTIVPSAAVILAAFSDIVITLAIFNLTGIKLSTAGIAAFLMLIGYSVDTDILLSTRVLKRREGTIMERIYSALHTGLIMNFTTLSAVSTALFFAQSDTIRQIMMILLIGLLVDMINTWIQNVGLLRLYLERKEGRHE